MLLIKPSKVQPHLLVLAVAFMLACVGSAERLKPHRLLAEEIGDPHYEKLIPNSFGDWKALPYGDRAVVNPQQAQTIAEIYSETFARSFINQKNGRMIMLSVAYGRDQTKETAVHTPDICYPAQGFHIDDRSEFDLDTPFGALKSVRLKTSQGMRHEPLTYFIRVGDTVARGSLDRNLARLHMAMRGYLVDGTIVRASEISDRADSFDLQAQFLRDLLVAVTPAARSRLIGDRKE